MLKIRLNAFQELDFGKNKLVLYINKECIRWGGHEKLGESEKYTKKYIIPIIISIIFGGLAIIYTNIYLNNMVKQSLD